MTEGSEERHGAATTGPQERPSKKKTKSPSAKARQKPAPEGQPHQEQAEESIPEELEAQDEPLNPKGGSKVTSKVSTPVNFQNVEISGRLDGSVNL